MRAVYYYFLLRSICFELDINTILSFLQTKYLTYGDKWEIIYSAVEFYILEWMYIFSSPNISPDIKDLNLSKATGHVMHHQFNIQQLYALPTLYLCVLYLSENKQRFVLLTA